MSTPTTTDEYVIEQTQKFGLKLTPLSCDVDAQNNQTVATGIGVYELQSDKFSGKNRVMPDLSKPVEGNLELSSDCGTVELECNITLEEVKEQVIDYINKHERFLTSDIIFDLCIDPDLVIEALEALEAEKKVESRDIQTSSKQ